ncbi:MAG: histidine kinase [Cytophagales bacterium]
MKIKLPFSNWLHPELQNANEKSFKTALIMLYMALGTLLVAPIVDLRYILSNPQAGIINYVFLSKYVAALLTLFVSRYSKNTNWLLLASCFYYFPNFINTFLTGGIYSMRIFWIIVFITYAYVFANRFWGTLITVFFVCYISVLYFYDFQHHQWNIENFLAQNQRDNIYFTYLAIVFFMSITLFIYTQSADKTDEQLKKLSEMQIEELEKRLKEKTDQLSEVRKNLARDFHDEMGNKLASINVLIQTAQLHGANGNMKDLNVNLQKMSARAKEVYQGTKDFIWSVDYKSEYVYEFYIYIRDFAEQFLETMQINFYANCYYTASSEVRLPIELNRQLIMICKEIITNAAKHSGCTQVSMEITEEHKFILLVIEDNGNGFNQETVSKRGLHNISERCKNYQIQLGFNSNKYGTRYEMKILKS